MAMAINEHGLAMIGSQESLGAQLVATAIWRGQGSLFRWDIIALLRNEVPRNKQRLPRGNLTPPDVLLVVDDPEERKPHA
jgi:hypothetical protein